MELFALRNDLKASLKTSSAAVPRGIKLVAHSAHIKVQPLNQQQSHYGCKIIRKSFWPTVENFSYSWNSIDWH